MTLVRDPAATMPTGSPALIPEPGGIPVASQRHPSIPSEWAAVPEGDTAGNGQALAIFQQSVRTGMVAWGSDKERKFRWFNRFAGKTLRKAVSNDTEAFSHQACLESRHPTSGKPSCRRCRELWPAEWRDWLGKKHPTRHPTQTRTWIAHWTVTSSAPPSPGFAQGQAWQFARNRMRRNLNHRLRGTSQCL
jgi:hypothetical protein